MDVIAGRYELHEVIGGGGTATVYRAVDRVLGVDRAVKVLLPARHARSTVQARFLREARAMAGLEHAHILRVYDFGVDASAYLVMQLATAGCISQLMRRGGITSRRAVRLAQQVLAALEHAHSRGVIHRDVKPGNILLSDRGEALLADFGIALVMDDQARQTRTGALLGTMAYMAPEQRLASKDVTPTADVYAVGATLFEMAGGGRPMDLFLAGVDSPRWASLPAALRPVIACATALEAAGRHPSAAAMSEALEAVFDQLPVDGEVTDPELAVATGELGDTVSVPELPGGARIKHPGQLANLTLWYQRSLSDKVGRLKTHIDALVASTPNAEATLRREVHSLRGSGTTFGFPQITEAAGLAEDAPSAGLLARTQELIYVLRHAADATSIPGEGTVLLGLPVGELERGVRLLLSRLGRDAKRVTDRADLLRQLDGTEATGIVVTDAMLGTDPAAQREVLDRLVHTSIPVFVLGGDRQRPEHQAAVVRLPADCGAAALGAMLEAHFQLGHTCDDLRGAPRILVADDDDDVAAMLKNIGSSVGCVVTRVSDGAQVLPAARKLRPDVVILDVEMPNVDGFEVLRQLRGDPLLFDTHVLMLTARSGDHAEIHGYKLGADDYVRKPFNPSMLASRLRRLTQRARRSVTIERV